MDDPLVQLVTRGVFGLVFILTLLDFLRWRDLPRLEIAAVFGGLALIITLQVIADATGMILPTWTASLSALAILAQPFLMVRVLGHFRRVPALQQVVAVVGLVVSGGLYVVFAASIPEWAMVVIVGAFAYVEGYATVAFVQSAFTQRGITQWRLIAIASGSGCLAALIVLSGLATTISSARGVAQPLVDVLALGSALGYWIGVAPPAWLRRVWQGGEVRRFLLGLSGLAGGERVVSTLEYLGPAAARATGGSGAIVALVKDEHSAELDLYADTRARAALTKSGLEKLRFDRSWVLSSVWQRGVCTSIGAQDDWGWELRRLADAMNARAALLAPLRAGDRSYGIFIVFINRSSPFVDDDLAVLGVLADQAALAIESAKLLEESVRGRATLAAVMSSMHDGLLVMDEDLTIRYCNSRASELLGVADRSLLGTPARNAFAQVESRLVAPDAVEARWRRALRDADTRPALEFELTQPARSVTAELFTVLATQPDGTRRGVGVVLRDVTAERDLVRTKDELVSVVSHELRTPLASVVGFAELLRTRELSEAQRNQFLTVILEEGRRLTALINDFLDLQRMESGRQEIRPRPVSLAELLERTIDASSPDPQRPIELDLPRGLPVVRVDSDRVQQLVTNLIANARKYSPNGGTIEVSARESDGQVIVSVQDHGLGLPADALPRLFEKFFRVDNSDRRSITGTGLGLAISRKIIEAHGGHIWAESAGLGHGSRFSFSLPVARLGGTSGDVLIVEDDAGFARLLEAELANRQISTVWVASAEEAMEHLAAERPKAVVLDLLLPGAQGEDFLRTLKGRRGWNLPVIVVTVKDLTQSERIALRQLSVQAILRKEPNVGSAAADLVQAVLRDHREHKEVAA